MTSFVLGVAGGTCTGKTTFCKNIQLIDKEKVLIINADSYYKEAKNRITLEEKNFDDPASIEWDLLSSVITKLKNGETVYGPIYDFVTHDRSSETIKLVPKPIIIVEGILIFYNPDLLNLFDKKIYIEVDCDVRYRRRIRRDVKERGRKESDINYQWDTFVKPAHNKYIEATKNFADIIITNNKQYENIETENIVNLDIVQIYIQHILSK